MKNNHLPDLSFQDIEYRPTESQWSLAPLLYRGGSSLPADKAIGLIKNEKLGPLLSERTSLVILFHEVLINRLAKGAARGSVKTAIMLLRQFYSWNDNNKSSPTEQNVLQLYIAWTDNLLARLRISRNIKQRTARDQAVAVSRIIEEALTLDFQPINSSRLPKKKASAGSLGSTTDKVNLQEAFAFGHMLLDIASTLTIEIIEGELPVKIILRTGQVLEEWCWLAPPEKIKGLAAKGKVRENILTNRAARIADTSWRTRHPLINLRVNAELFIFISQTQMNLAQAQKLRVGKFSYKSHLDGYQVRRIYKNRRAGEVEFFIYKEYRAHFEKYLKWRSHYFGNDPDGLLFPFTSFTAAAPHTVVSFTRISDKCKKLGLTYFGPRALRSIKINWLARRSNNTELVAQLAQHSEKTLVNIYDKPNYQAALSEITLFHKNFENTLPAPGPGICSKSEPQGIPGIAHNSPKPNCINSAGCLFCIYNLDIDEMDHVWSLASYRHLKTLELSRYRQTILKEEEHPALITIQKLNDKLNFFRTSSLVRSTWVSEAMDRIKEDKHHPKWEGFIKLLELGI
ncbi:site-specific integrase [Stutzerimonas stutzeri]|uniref:site-specific integrase n=1 Tax=Stutzerimonas stutzeri TaxID=316 RepID=UPI000A894CBF|nr:site-specific integrase [Stutzerimonas stutzeri]MCQ4284811.1 site-specific integrase [Stutzerimonas stutzeri]